MKCFVCGAEMTPYFEKKLDSTAKEYIDKPEIFEYVRCENCGLVVSKTLYEMSHEDWSAFNTKAHKAVFDQKVDYKIVDPSWLKRLETQANMFVNLVNLGIFKDDWRTIDFGAGDGKLANKINERLKKVWLKKFDAYMEPLDENYLTKDEVKPQSFDFLVSTSVFEHLLGTQGDVEKIIDLIKPDGTMALHTLICEEVPQDPEWFYLLPVPVHCTLWTNKAMSITYKKFGFKGCAYNLPAQMWLFFRDRNLYLELKNNKEKLQGNYFFSDDFVDYWKVKPYRK